MNFWSCWRVSAVTHSLACYYLSSFPQCGHLLDIHILYPNFFPHSLQDQLSLMGLNRAEKVRNNPNGIPQTHKCNKDMMNIRIPVIRVILQAVNSVFFIIVLSCFVKEGIRKLFYFLLIQGSSSTPLVPLWH